MIIYPDNNIIVDIEKGNLSFDQLKELIGTDTLILPFSDAHLYEADTMSAYNEFTKEQLLEQRFKVLDKLSNGMYLTTRNKQTVCLTKGSKEAYYAIDDFPGQQRIKQGFQENMINAMRAVFRKVGGLEKNIINNMPSNQIIPYLDNQLCKTELGSLTEMINESKRQMAESGSVSRYDQIAMYFGLLDLVGFYRDTETDKSDFARMWDSNHVDYATETQGFLSKDKRARKKAELIYHILNIQTRVLAI